MTTVILLGTLDTKGREYAYLRDRLTTAGVDTTLVDVGVLGDPAVQPDVTAADVAAAAGWSLSQLRQARHDNDARAAAMRVMQDGATTLVHAMMEQGRCDGVLALGGSGGSQLSSGVMRSLPFGLPKLLVSTMVSGDVSAYVGSSDICLMHAVTDIAGLNRISRQVLRNAASAMAGMVTNREVPGQDADAPPTVAVTMLGVTTPGVLRVVQRLEAAGFEPIVFHAVGSGGRAMEELLAQGVLSAVIDYTPKEVTDELLGGIFVAGPQRLRTAGRLGRPQVVVPGAVEVLNFGPRESVPPALHQRPIVEHNASVTAVRIDADEATRVGHELAARLNEALGPVVVVLPTHGFDSYSAPGGPFEDAELHMALISALRSGLRNGIDVLDVEGNVNDAAFADAVADAFLEVNERPSPPRLVAGGSAAAPRASKVHDAERSRR